MIHCLKFELALNASLPVCGCACIPYQAMAAGTDGVIHSGEVLMCGEADGGGGGGGGGDMVATVGCLFSHT